MIGGGGTGSTRAWERMCPDLGLSSSATIVTERRGREGSRKGETQGGGLLSPGRESTQSGLLLRKFPGACGLRPTQLGINDQVMN